MFLPVLPPDEAVALLRDRRSRLEEQFVRMQAELKAILERLLRKCRSR